MANTGAQRATRPWSGLAHRLVLRGDMLLERETMTNDEAMASMIQIALDGLKPQT